MEDDDEAAVYLPVDLMYDSYGKMYVAGAIVVLCAGVSAGFSRDESTDEAISGVYDSDVAAFGASG